MAEATEVDIWSGLDHKTLMRSDDFGHLHPWVPARDRRRNTAYIVIKAYLNNVARRYLAPLPDDPERENGWQEFGDAAVLMSRIAAGIVGKDPTVSIVGADEPIPAQAEINDAPVPPERAAMTEAEFAVRSAAYEAAITAWQADAEAALNDWAQAIEKRPRLRRRQDWLRQWAQDENLIAKIIENETDNIVPLGTGLYVLGWDPHRQRPTVEIYEPDAYYPDLDDARPSEYPDRVHLAWPIQPDEDSDEEDKTRRITYERIDITGVDGNEFDVGETPGYLTEGQEQTHIVRLSDGTWDESAFEDTSLYDINQGATWRKIIVDGEEVELRDYVTGYDFIPVVAVTHDLALLAHFGKPPIVSLAQILDELAASDTDESLTSRWASRPPFTVSGMSQSGNDDADNSIPVRPGFAIKVKEGGGVDVIDLAQSLAALGERIKGLLKRLSVNASVPEGLLGRVDASEVPSGLALTLSFTPFEGMTDAGQLARDSKYALLLKFAQRIQVHHAGGFPGDNGEIDTDDTEIYPAELTFGANMPQDLPGMIELVSRAVEAMVMSQQTAIRLLSENGVNVEDESAELAAIRARMGEEAERITQATGDPGAGAAFLGYREVDDEAPAENAEGAGDPTEQQDPAGTTGPGIIDET